MISDPLFYAAAIPAVILVGLAKGGIGGSIGILAVPLMALVVSPIQAAGILLPILCVMDIVGVTAYRKLFDRATVLLLLPAGTVGVVIGWATAAYVEENFVRLIVGLIAVLFSLDYWIAKRATKAPAEPSTTKGWFWGATAGFTSFVSHAGGPPFQMYVLPLRFDRRIFAGTAAVFFAVVNYVKLVPYFFLGQFDTANLATALTLLPLAPLATMTGVWLVRVIDQTSFYRLIYAIVFVVGLKLTWDGISAFI